VRFQLLFCEAPRLVLRFLEALHRALFRFFAFPRLAVFALAVFSSMLFSSLAGLMSLRLLLFIVLGILVL
jgi:hypothetical protein